MNAHRPQDVRQGGRAWRWRRRAFPWRPVRARPSHRPSPGNGRRPSCWATSPRGPCSPTFQLLKDAGFEGVELISPNQLDLKRSPRRAGQDRAGDPRRQRRQALGAAPLRPRSRRWSSAAWPRSAQEFLDCKAYGGTTVLVVPAVVNKKVSYRDAYTRSQENIRKLIPYAEQAGVKIAIEEVWNKFLLSPVEFARYIDEFASPTRRRLLRRRQRRRVRLPRGVDPRAGQADPQDPHQGIRQAQAVRLQARRGRDRLARRAPGARRRRLRGMDHRRGRLRRPGGHEGRGAADEPVAATGLSVSRRASLRALAASIAQAVRAAAWRRGATSPRGCGAPAGRPPWRADVGLQHLAHLLQGVAVLLLCVRGDAVAGTPRRSRACKRRWP